MKASRYNIYIPINGVCVVYNSLTGALFETNMKGIKTIQEVRKEKFNKETIQELKKNGIWVDDTIDEIKIFQVFHERYKYSGNRAYICSYVTFNCNLACEYCFLKYFNLNKSAPPMSNKTACIVAEFAKNVVHNNHCSELITVFTGGEPLLNFYAVSTIIKKLDNWTKEQGVKYKSIIFSNGVSLTEDILNELSKYNNSVFFQITLAGSRSVHNKKRPFKNSSGSYDIIINTLELLKNYKSNFGIRVDVDKENFDSIEEMLEDIVEKIGIGMYIKFFPILQLYPQAKHHFELNELRRLSTLWKLARKKGFKVVLTPLIKYVYCEYHTNRSYILDPNGYVYKCGEGVGFKDRKIGSLDSSGRLTAITHQYYDWMSRSPLLMEKCRNCEFLPACGGGCAGVARSIHNTYHMSDCRERYLIIERIKFYMEGGNQKWRTLKIV